MTTGNSRNMIKDNDLPPYDSDGVLEGGVKILLNRYCDIV